MYTRARALVILHLRGSPAGPYNPAPSTIMGRTRLHLPVAWVLIMASVLALFAKTVSPMSPVADIPSTPLSFTSVVPEAPTTDATPTARHSLTVVTPASHVFVVAAPTSRASIVGPLASTASFIFVFSSSAWTSSRASVVKLPGSTQFGAPGPPFLGPTSTPGWRTDTFTVGDVGWRQIPAALVSAASSSRASVVSSSASSSARTSVSATSAQRMPAAGPAPTASRVFPSVPRPRRPHVASAPHRRRRASPSSLRPLRARPPSACRRRLDARLAPGEPVPTPTVMAPKRGRGRPPQDCRDLHPAPRPGDVPRRTHDRPASPRALAGRAPRTGRDGPARHPDAPHRAPHTRKPAHTRHLSRRARSPPTVSTALRRALFPLRFSSVVHGVSPVSPAFLDDPTQFSHFHSSFPLPRSPPFVYSCLFYGKPHARVGHTDEVLGRTIRDSARLQWAFGTFGSGLDHPAAIAPYAQPSPSR